MWINREKLITHTTFRISNIKLYTIKYEIQFQTLAWSYVNHKIQFQFKIQNTNYIQILILVFKLLMVWF